MQQASRQVNQRFITPSVGTDASHAYREFVTRCQAGQKVVTSDQLVPHGVLQMAVLRPGHWVQIYMVQELGMNAICSSEITTERHRNAWAVLHWGTHFQGTLGHLDNPSARKAPPSCSDLRVCLHNSKLMRHCLYWCGFRGD